jgi:hypothetical protein
MDSVTERNFRAAYPQSVRDAFWQLVEHSLQAIFQKERELARRYRQIVEASPVGEQMNVYHREPINVAADLSEVGEVTREHMAKYAAMRQSSLQNKLGHSEESFDVIAADEVEGTSVYDAKGDKIGTIRNVMMDKISGKVVYASLAFGGMPGMGQKYHALPWDLLTYNTELGGYQVDIDRNNLEQGPAATEEELTDNYKNQEWARKVYIYYGSS